MFYLLVHIELRQILVISVFTRCLSCNCSFSLDAEDITDLIKEANKNDNTQETKNFTFFPDDFQTVPMDPVSEEVARKACEVSIFKLIVFA
jgi:hypothetical protein